LIQQKIKRYTAPLKTTIEAAPVKDSAVIVKDSLKPAVQPE
jgi:hypothetical protein